MRRREFDRKSGFEDQRKFKHLLGFSADASGQPWPQDWTSVGTSNEGSSHDPLGEPLTIREVAKLIGCSVWTVRHRYLDDGLSHFRTGPTGKLIFYRNQVIRWLLKEQQKGGE